MSKYIEKLGRVNVGDLMLVQRSKQEVPIYCDVCSDGVSGDYLRDGVDFKKEAVSRVCVTLRDATLCQGTKEELASTLAPPQFLSHTSQREFFKTVI